MNIKTTNLSLVVALLLFTGCATIPKEKQILPDSNSTKERISKIQNETDSPLQNKIRPIMDESVSGTFFKATAYEAVSAIAQQLNIKMDSSYVPSEKYKITADVSSSFSDFLKLVKNNTGIDYKLRNNLLTVTNKDLLEESISGKQCQANAAPSVTMSVMEPVSPDAIFDMFSQKYNMSFLYKTKYFNIGGKSTSDTALSGMQVPMSTSLPDAPKVVFHYSGCDYQEAFRTFLKASNLVAEETGKDSYTISDYEVSTVDVPLYFNYKFDSSAGGVGSSSSGVSTSSGGGVSDLESQKDSLQKFIQSYVSSKGKVDVSSRGYITIEDTPDNVRNVKKILAKEISKQRPIKLNISIIRTALSNNKAAGVDWMAIGNLFSKGANVKMGTNYSSSVSGGGYLSIDTGSGIPTLINALEKYGNTKVVREYNAITKLGILNSFKAVEEIPYVTTSTTVSSGISQTNFEAKTAETGVIINVTPRLDSTQEYIDISTSVTVSELMQMVTFNMQGNSFNLPQIASNAVNIPAKIKLNQTLILTGFKTNTKSGGATGLPGVSKTPEGLGWLMGTETSDSDVSEFVIVITPTEIEEI
jgi:hypothetical protein